MRRGVTYQSMLGEPAGAPGGTYVRLGEGAVRTRRKDALKEISVEISTAQKRWLRNAVELSGDGIDDGQIVRVMIDLGMELEIDWAVLASGRGLREAVRDSVMVRRRAAG